MEAEGKVETTLKDIALHLRSTEAMADQFVQRIQERVGHPVSNDEIMAVMKKMSVKQLSMEKVVAKLAKQSK